MKLKYTFEMMEVDEQTMAVPVGDGAEKFHGILKLNDSAAAILELLKEDTTLEAVTEKLLEQFDSSKEGMEEYVTDYVNQLKEAGLIIE